MKGLEEMLGVMNMFMILKGDDFTDASVSKCVKLHTLFTIYYMSIIPQ